MEPGIYREGRFVDSVRRTRRTVLRMVNTYNQLYIKNAELFDPTDKSVLFVHNILSRIYFKIWKLKFFRYDIASGRSRIDYYGGMVKTYQLTKQSFGGAGSSIKIAPVTTEQQYNVPMCLQVNGSDENSIDVQSVLPDLTGFSYLGTIVWNFSLNHVYLHEILYESSGTETINGEKAQKWRLVQDIGEKTNKYTMWIKFKKPSSDQSSIPIPIRYNFDYNMIYKTLMEYVCV